MFSCGGCWDNPCTCGADYRGRDTDNLRAIHAAIGGELEARSVPRPPPRRPVNRRTHLLDEIQRAAYGALPDDLPELARCPYAACRSRARFLLNLRPDPDGPRPPYVREVVPLWCVECPVCNARGFSSEDPREAIRQWNELAGRAV